MIYLITALVLVAYLALAWLLGSWMHLTGLHLWTLRGGLSILGTVAAGAFLWFRQRGKSSSAPEPSEEIGEDEIDLLLRAAEGKLNAAKLSHGSGLNKMPVALVLGLPGSTKTSVVANSGLDPELLAGTVNQDGAVAPTRSINVWFAAGTVLLEAAGSLLLDAKKWTAFVHRIRPAPLSSALQRGPQSPRLALVCFDAETLLTSPAEAANQVRTLRARLGDLAQGLGTQVPVYVLFTRLDTLPFFPDYVRTFSADESINVLGCTLPLEALSPGLYSQQQAARISESFEQLFTSMALKRLAFLPRDNDDLKSGCAYEFPREFRKLRAAASDFLVELCRPSQFSVGPVLRGYYFTGVRPVVVEAPVPASSVAHKQKARVAEGATALFRPAIAVEEQEPPSVQRPRSSRRVPQWMFLTKLFRDVILVDRAAMAASGASVHTNTTRRMLLATATVVSVLLATTFSVSWGRNHALQSEALAAARALSLDGSHSEPASLDALRRLDTLRDSVERLAQYHSKGAPLSYRWGLYRGDALYPELRRLYFARFRTLLFGDTQNRLVEALRSLPAKPGTDYGPVYDSLKAYLMTTSNHDRSTPNFLQPVLLDRWSNLRGIDSNRQALAGRQFTFYAEQLREENPYDSTNDAFAVAAARGYLGQFGGTERVYKAILAEAVKANPPIDFNGRYPGSAAAVVDSYQVSGAFTLPGWQFTQQAIRNPAPYSMGEEWVLGSTHDSNVSALQLQTQLRTRYSNDYLNAWRTYLKSASVAHYASLPDASRKLDLLSGNRSPLLALLALASENTAVGDPVISGAFQPVQAVVPATSADRFIAPPNQPYMSALIALQSSVEQAVAQTEQSTDPSATLAAAANARIAAKQIAQSFKPDPNGRVDATVEKLLEDPITQVEALLRVLGPQELNAKGKALCTELRPLFSKYPFDRTASTEATVAEVNAAFRKPDGAVWSFYNTNLQKLVSLQGSRFVPNATTGVSLTPGFIAFLNQMAAVSDSLYGGGSQDPQFTYSLKPVATDGIQSLGLSMDGQALSYDGGAGVAKQFAWQFDSAAHEAKASVRFGSGPDLVWSNSQGPWAIFHFFDKADQWQASATGSGSTLEWTIRIGKDPVTLPDGKPLTVRLNLTTATTPSLLQKSFANGFSCVAQISR